MRYKINIELEIDIDPDKINMDSALSDEEKIAFDYEVWNEDTAEMNYEGRTISNKIKVNKVE